MAETGLNSMILNSVCSEFFRRSKESDSVFQLGDSGQSNWSEIDTSNIAKIIENKNFQLLEKKLIQIVAYDLDSITYNEKTEENVVKIFKIAQLGVAYLMHRGSFFDKRLIFLEERLSALQAEYQSLKQQTINTEIKRSKKKHRGLHFQCVECGKMFIGETYLTYHQKRRHGNHLTISEHETLAENSKATETADNKNEEKFDNFRERKNFEEKDSGSKIKNLEMELEELKRRLSKTEKSIERERTPNRPLRRFERDFPDEARIRKTRTSKIFTNECSSGSDEPEGDDSSPASQNLAPNSLRKNVAELDFVERKGPKMEWKGVEERFTTISVNEKHNSFDGMNSKKCFNENSVKRSSSVNDSNVKIKLSRDSNAKSAVEKIMKKSSSKLHEISAHLKKSLTNLYDSVSSNRGRLEGRSVGEAEEKFIEPFRPSKGKSNETRHSTFKNSFNGCSEDSRDKNFTKIVRPRFILAGKKTISLEFKNQNGKSEDGEREEEWEEEKIEKMFKTKPCAMYDVEMASESESSANLRGNNIKKSENPVERSDLGNESSIDKEIDFTIFQVGESQKRTRKSHERDSGFLVGK